MKNILITIVSLIAAYLFFAGIYWNIYWISGAGFGISRLVFFIVCIVILFNIFSRDEEITVIDIKHDKDKKG